LASAHQECGAQRLLHIADARRRGSERQVGALGAMRDASRLDDMAKQTEIGEIKAHAGAFEFDEGILREKLIVRHINSSHIRGARSSSGASAGRQAET
jgi:hypothetical protein